MSTESESLRVVQASPTTQVTASTAPCPDSASGATSLATNKPG